MLISALRFPNDFGIGVEKYLFKAARVEQVVTVGLCSQRRARRYLGLHRSIGRNQNKGPTEWLLRLREQHEALSRKQAFAFMRPSVDPDDFFYCAPTGICPPEGTQSGE